MSGRVIAAIGAAITFTANRESDAWTDAALGIDPFSRPCTIGDMPEPTNDLQNKKNELERQLQGAITKFEADTGLTVTEIAPHRLPTQDSWNQLRGLKLRIELLEKA